MYFQFGIYMNFTFTIELLLLLVIAFSRSPATHIWARNERENREKKTWFCWSQQISCENDSKTKINWQKKQLPRFLNGQQIGNNVIDSWYTQPARASDRRGGSAENDVIETMAKNCSNKEIGRNKFENNFICHKRNNNFWNVFFPIVSSTGCRLCAQYLWLIELRCEWFNGGNLWQLQKKINKWVLTKCK